MLEQTKLHRHPVQMILDRLRERIHTHNDIGTARLLRQSFCTIIITLHHLYIRIGEGEGFGGIAQEYGNVVLRVRSHKGMQDGATNVPCPTGAGEGK